MLLDQSGAARLRRRTTSTVVLTYMKGVLSYKVVLKNRYCAHDIAIGGDFYGWPLVTIAFRNSEGVILTCFLNAVLKADFELKPTSSDTARME